MTGRSRKSSRYSGRYTKAQFDEAAKRTPNDVSAYQQRLSEAVAALDKLNGDEAA